MKHPYRWLDRRVAAPGPYLTLCLTEAEFHDALRRLKLHERPTFVRPSADATTHYLTKDNREQACIVCLRGWEKRDSIEIAGLLVHEAVHVWQVYCERIGEEQPGVEQEAYAIQAIAQELMAEFRRRLSTLAT